MNKYGSTQLTVDVGILKSASMVIDFLQTYISPSDGRRLKGEVKFTATIPDRNGLELKPEKPTGSFEIKDVVIGNGFHWQQKENQRFYGCLILRKVDDGILAINRLPVEQYLESVISSEMNANASLELLKAHAVISRSWLMARIIKQETKKLPDSGMTETGNVRVRWYDNSQHHGFDVCADDHCQRYQGITRILNPNAIEAVKSTAGEILSFDGKICDARFSKCCGGAFETFENCWQPTPLPYLGKGRDILPHDEYHLPDLTVESNAEKWINGNPDSFCNTKDTAVLRQILNSYDLVTPDFFRWKVEYSQAEIAGIIRNRSGIDFGDILDIIPLERGVSGRLVKAKITGTKRSMTIGKELEIRKTLSVSHLYSSAFTVEKVFSNAPVSENNLSGGVPNGFILKGAGWGHGVGLCQIGAAMMAEHGYSYRQILFHYYQGAELKPATDILKGQDRNQHQIQLHKSK